MIEIKQETADQVVGATSERWLTELSKAELRDVVALSVAPWADPVESWKTAWATPQSRNDDEQQRLPVHQANRGQRRHQGRVETRCLRLQLVAKRWLQALEGGFQIGNRLGRGHLYARRGQVISIDVRTGGVTAKVQGSRKRPYDVSIGVRTLTPPDWERIQVAMVEQPIIAASLLSGRMPDNIEDTFRSVGLSMFPDRRVDLETDCSCPDWSNPLRRFWIRTMPAPPSYPIWLAPCPSSWVGSRSGGATANCSQPYRTSTAPPRIGQPGCRWIRRNRPATRNRGAGRNRHGPQPRLWVNRLPDLIVVDQGVHPFALLPARGLA